jgi:hypothetical protein
MTTGVPADFVQPKPGRHRPGDMTRRIHAGAAVGLLLAAAGCGTASTGVGNGGPATSTSLPFATGAPTTPNIATPDASVVDLRKTRFTHAAVRDGGELVVEYTAAGLAECSKLGRVDVAESADAVTVTVLLGRLPGRNCTGPQPMIAAIFDTVVRLGTPLGNRRIQDGAA